MKIMIGGSLVFAKEQLKTKKFLEEKGHVCLVTDDIQEYIDRPEIKKSFEEELKISKRDDVMKTCFNKIDDSDAFLVCNYDKNGVKGYLGTSVLMELGLALHLGKKIFLLNDYDKSQNYALEVALINPVILNGDLGGVDGNTS